MNRYGSIILTSVLSCVVTLGIIWSLGFGQSDGNTYRIEHHSATPSQATNYSPNTAATAPFDFTFAAEKVSPAVVFIRNTMQSNRRQTTEGNPNDLFRQFFGPDFDMPQNFDRSAPRPSIGAGSGVIISPDGYIVTNNHVIDKSIDLEVRVGDKDTYKATLVGTDPTTDIALLKIDDVENLPYIDFADSDLVKIGEWVAAVGNPFDLETTVTAGIVSAKGRSINIIGRKSRDRTAIESFIQTDAAVNPGNSGGALVNTEGKLIGINTAIASPTGSYSGYSFAVPSTLVRKVVDDLREYGTVQRGFIGASIIEVNQALADDRDLEINYGVYVDTLVGNSSAKDAGMQKGDIITAINDTEIRTSPELLEQIGRHRPGDVVKLTYLRDGETRIANVTLKSADGSTKIVRKKSAEGYAVLGIDVEEMNESELSKLDINNGIRVSNIRSGRIASQTDMAEGFIITEADGKSVNSVSGFKKIIQNAKGIVVVKGRYETMPGMKIYAFDPN